MFLIKKLKLYIVFSLFSIFVVPQYMQASSLDFSDSLVAKIQQVTEVFQTPSAYSQTSPQAPVQQLAHVESSVGGFRGFVRSVYCGTISFIGMKCLEEGVVESIPNNSLDTTSVLDTSFVQDHIDDFQKQEFIPTSQVQSSEPIKINTFVPQTQIQIIERILAPVGQTTVTGVSYAVLNARLALLKQEILGSMSAGTTIINSGGGASPRSVTNLRDSLRAQIDALEGVSLTDISGFTTTDLGEGSNLYHTQARFDSAFGTKSTSDLIEGTNLYFTDTRARSVLSSTATGLSYTSGTGDFSLTSGYVIPTQIQLDNKQDTLTIGTTDQYIRGDLSLGTFPTTVSSFSNDSGYLTGVNWNQLGGTQTDINVSGFANDVGYLTSVTGLNISELTNDSNFISNLSSFTTDNLTQGSNNLYSQWENATGGINYAGGNVGLGTATPDKKLTIQQVADADGIKLYGYDDRNSDYLDIFIAATGRPVFSSNNSMVFQSANNYFTAIGSNYFDLRSAASKFIVRDQNYTNVAHINETGGAWFSDNVGIGTTTPLAKLDVNGNVRVVGGLTVTNGAFSHTIVPFAGFENRLSFGLHGGNSLIFYGGTSGGSSAVTWNSNSGTVFDISPGGRRVSFGDGTDVWIQGTGSDFTKNLKQEFTSGAGLIYSTDGHIALQHTGAYNVGIGTTTPSEKLSIIGNAYVSTNVGINIAPSTTNRLYVRETSASSNYQVVAKFENTGSDQARIVLRTNQDTATGERLIGSQFSTTAGVFSFQDYETRNFAIRTGTSVGSNVQRLYIANSGNTAFGNFTDPASTVSISGNTSIGSAYQAIAAPTNGLLVEGNVGIGTSAPAYNLDVVGTAQISSQLRLVSTNNVELLFTGTQDANIYHNGSGKPLYINTLNGPIHLGATGSGSTNLSVSSTGNIGIGTTTPASKLQIDTGATATKGLIVNGYTSQSANLAELNYDATTYAQFNNKGSLYIRNEDVANPSLLTLDGPFGSVNIYGSSVDASNINLFSSQILYVGRGGGGLGVGAYTGPITSKFAVKGNAVIGTNYNLLTAPTNGLLVEGNVGIGTTSPSQKLHVEGNARFTGVGSGAYAFDLNLTTDGELTTSASDQRLKENIKTLDSVEILEKILQLNSTTFDWKSNSAHDIGLIAQEVELVFPELVFTNPTDGFKGINYSRLPTLLISAVQELFKIVSEFANLIETKLIRSDKIETQELCIDDVCITKDQLEQLLNGSNSSRGSTDTTSSSGDSLGDTTHDTASTTPEEATQDTSSQEDGSQDSSIDDSSETNEGSEETGESLTQELEPVLETEDSNDPEPADEPVSEPVSGVISASE